ncbi:leucine-rich repeat receptor-like serine/threonine-protein kinase SKM1 [Ricinus communis]|uniref:non-specific serine/threonine protein kinase n=1 Tax=Ricinus communis TaxID=3988 RepID=B9RRZ6_RICCO|nr:leucine-rich repeat receptor-like serine/threonine-protein kinase SKM1 [Ricinus communis]EEF45856.1 Receptor protein kinase CLAVATA1 precursor, putative [Ricinus communis]|eukprot:XP_002516515.1 probably inactive leucine-rich repeat receptor-like protein kinase At2g25790 [Ricinus communis]
MAKKGPSECSVMLFMFLLFFLNFHMLHAEDELELLLSFKSSVNDPFQYLFNWNSSATVCKWQGITCNNSSRIKSIDLPGKNISGKLSLSIFQLPYVEIINLSSNQLSFQIPDAIFYSSSSILHLNLSNNNFTGPIPGGSISCLETLDLSNNMLSGKIPLEIGSFSSLKFLDLGGNVLMGKIPISLTNITSLQFLTLASNQLVGQIPRELGQMRSLKWIYLGYNNLSGEIPNEIGRLTSLNHLDLVYNNLTGSIPVSFGNLTNLQYLFLYQNKLTDPIPNSVFNLRKLISLDLSDNFLSGEIPELVLQLQNLEILHLFSNKFTGKIPGALCSLPRLQVLQLWSNNFTGEIPRDLGKQNNFTVLDLSTNSLTGEIPEGLCSSGNLFKLILFSNSLEGEIPKDLGACRSLKRVRLQENNLSGELPQDFTKLPLVYFLDISSNNFSGRLESRKWEMTSLQMLNLARNKFSGGLPDSFGSDQIENLDLSQNRFSGTIPRTLRKLSELMQLKLSGNKLSGEIPDELSSCKKLVSLDLSDNQLNGQIPDSFSEMPVLSQLDLSQNQLSGDIPTNLGGVESLVQVNISHNHFHGSLPSTGAFLAINASAVAGNELLCGGDTSSGLPPCRRVIKNPTRWFYIACILGAFLVLSLVAFGFVFIRGRKNLELKRVENEDGIWELQFFQSKVSKSVTMEDILSSKREENIISRGKKGLSYKGKSIINGVHFMVKEINDVNSISSNFWPDTADYGKLQHPNIVKLIGMCRSEQGAYLVYEYIEGKNLSEILRNLSWERRRKIATGIAKALRFLHCHCSPNVLVGYMSPEKIIIDGQDEPHLRLSLPEPFCTDVKCFISSAYVAPETRDSKDITEKSDMYGFGLILIQLLTGKSPADPEFGVHESIVEWARYCYSDCHLDMWVDPAIKGHVLVNQNEIVEAMNLALHCTATDPTARPCASDAFKTLESALRTTSSCVTKLKFSSPF